MRKVMIAASAVAVALAATALAYANEPYFPKAKSSFDRVDANKDGKLALTEFAPLADRRLASADGNGDKQVTAAEIEAQLQQRLERRRIRLMQLLDRNGDGAITQGELDKVVEDMFNDADANRDGGLTMAEIGSFKRAKWRKAYVESIPGLKP